MKNKLYLALALFLSTWGPGCVELAHAGNGSGNVSNVAIIGASSANSAGLANVSLSDLKAGTVYSLSCGIGGGGTSLYTAGCRKGGSLAQAGANGAICFAISFQSNTASSGAQMMYSDSSSWPPETAPGSLTNPVYQFSSSGNTLMRSVTVDVPVPMPITWAVPANKYIGFQYAGGSPNYVIYAHCIDK